MMRNSDISIPWVFRTFKSPGYLRHPLRNEQVVRVELVQVTAIASTRRLCTKHISANLPLPRYYERLSMASCYK